MQPLSTCSHNKIVLIESGGKDWSFIYSIVQDIDISFSNEVHKHPIPYGTEITDHVKRNMDRVTIRGVVGCLSCGNESTIDNIIPELKRLSERMMYCKEDFVRLTSNLWQARYMILTNVNTKERQNSPQVLEVTTEWVGANLTGTIRDPYFQRGGIIH